MEYGLSPVISLMMTILALVLGRLADLFGRVRLYNLGFAVFTLGSLFCALSQNGEQLVIFRFLQGTGAALLAVNSVAIITDAFPKGELGMGLGTNIMAMNVGAIAGFNYRRCDDYRLGLEVHIPDKCAYRYFRDNLGLSAS